MLPAKSKHDGVSADLPVSRPSIDPLREPMVGNETVDDNITECAQLAIWSALAGNRSNVAVSVVEGTATVAGTVQTDEQRRSIAKAVARVKGVSRVVDRVRIARLRPLRAQLAPRATALALEQIAARPMLYVVRYCVLDEASISAAMRQAVPMLDSALAARGAPPMNELIVIYRNRVPGAVTVEIGVPIDPSDELMTGGEPAVGQAPSGTMISKGAEAGLQDLLHRETDLVATARAAGLEADTYLWQSFTAEQAHNWRGHPEVRVFLPIIAQSAHHPATPSGVPL